MLWIEDIFFFLVHHPCFRSWIWYFNKLEFYELWFQVNSMRKGLFSPSDVRIQQMKLRRILYNQRKQLCWNLAIPLCPWWISKVLPCSMGDFIHMMQQNKHSDEGFGGGWLRIIQPARISLQPKITLVQPRQSYRLKENKRLEHVNL